MPAIELNVPFTLVTCDGCGQARPAGARCPSCGSTTIFDDPSVDRRRRIVGRVRPLLHEPTGIRTQIAPTDVFGALGQWADPFLHACAQVMDDTEDEAVGRMGLSARTLREIEDRVAATPHAKGDPAAWSTIDGVLAALRGVIDEYFAALTAADPAVCQEHGAAAQRSLDAAGQIAATLGARLTRQSDEESGFWRGLFVGALGGWLFGRHRP